MKLRFLILPFIIHFFSFNSFSQIAYIVGTHQKIESKSFNSFKDNYTQLHKSSLKENPTIEKPRLGFTVGLMVKGQEKGIFEVGGSYTRNSSVSTFFFNDGAEQQFTFKNNFLAFDIGMPITLLKFNKKNDIENSVKLYPEIGASMGNARIVSETKKGSPINSKLISGNFKGFHGNLMYGGSLNISIFSGVGLRVGVKKFIPMFPTRLIDKSKEFLEDRKGPNYSEDVTDDFRYFQFSVGAMVDLNVI